MGDTLVNKNAYYICNDTVYMFIANEATVSLLNNYNKVLEVETKFGSIFCMPYKESKGTFCIDTKYNIYLDLKTGNHILVEVTEDKLYENRTNIDFKRMFEGLYLNGPLPVFSMSQYQDDYRFRTYVDYLDSIFCKTYEGTIDDFIGKGITGIYTNVPAIFVGSRVDLCGIGDTVVEDTEEEFYFTVEHINGTEFSVYGDDTLYNICDVRYVDNCDLFINRRIGNSIIYSDM